MKARMRLSDTYAELAGWFAARGEFAPSHCDVRCAVNDIMERDERDGWRVNHGYDQDRAFATVRRILATMR